MLDDVLRHGVHRILHGGSENGVVHPFWHFYSAKSDDEPCIFKIGESIYWEYKIAQLELRLAVFLAKRRLKFTKDDLAVTDVVAACGVCIPEVDHDYCHTLLASEALSAFDCPAASNWKDARAALRSTDCLSSSGT